MTTFSDIYIYIGPIVKSKSKQRRCMQKNTSIKAQISNLVHTKRFSNNRHQVHSQSKGTLVNTEGEIKNGQSRETGNKTKKNPNNNTTQYKYKQHT